MEVYVVYVSVRVVFCRITAPPASTCSVAGLVGGRPDLALSRQSNRREQTD